MQDNAIPCNTMQCHAIPCNTMQLHAIPKPGLKPELFVQTWPEVKKPYSSGPASWCSGNVFVWPFPIAVRRKSERSNSWRHISALWQHILWVAFCICHCVEPPSPSVCSTCLSISNNAPKSKMLCCGYFAVGSPLNYCKAGGLQVSTFLQTEQSLRFSETESRSKAFFGELWPRR